MIVQPHNWWDYRGVKVCLTKSTNKVVVLEDCHDDGRKGTLVSVSIHRFKDIYRVNWNIRHLTSDSYASGIVFMERKVLAEAFGVNQAAKPIRTFNYDREMSCAFRCTTCKAGQFIRWRSWLNIPGPSTHTGTPAVSIDLDKKIRKAVRRLLRNRH